MIEHITEAEKKRRLASLQAADRHCDIEGLPPTSEFAKTLDERWVNGEISRQEAIDALIAHHRVDAS